MQKLICVTGMDGSGKSTLVKHLAKSLPSCHVASVWDILEGGVTTPLFKSKRDVDRYLCELTANSRLLFLAHALRFSVDRAMLSRKKIVLLNAYYFKYFASELALGADPMLVNRLITSFPKPELCIYLDLPATVAATRKSSFSRYECGLSEKPGKENFVKFQQAAGHCWSTFNKKQFLNLDASLPQNKLLEATLNKIK